MKHPNNEIGDAKQHGVASKRARHGERDDKHAPIEASITSRTLPSSTSVALVSQA